MSRYVVRFQYEMGVEDGGRGRVRGDVVVSAAKICVYSMFTLLQQRRSDRPAKLQPNVAVATWRNSILILVLDILRHKSKALSFLLFDQLSLAKCFPLVSIPSILCSLFAHKTYMEDTPTRTKACTTRGCVVGNPLHHFRIV